MNDIVNLNNSLFYGLQLDKDQRNFVNSINNRSKLLISCEAEAGSGKTLISVAMATLLVLLGEYDKFIYIVAPCQEHYMGYLPGTLEEKSRCYYEPLIQALIELNFEPSKILSTNVEALKRGSAYVYPMTHTYLRGVNFSKSVVIIDETQNLYTDELRKILTRCHDSCKVIMLGNDKQCDLVKNSQNSGFSKARRFFRSENPSWYAECELHTNHRGVLARTADKL